MSTISDHQIDIFSLDISISIINSKKEVDQLKPPEISFLSKAFELYLNHYQEVNGSEPDPKIKDLSSFLKSNPIFDLGKIREFLKKDNRTDTDIEEETSKLNKPEKEDSTIPVNLVTMRASYEANQASLIENEKLKNSVSETIKRARKTWNEKRKIDLIYENAEKQNKEQEEKRQAEIDKYYLNAVDSKAKSKAEITQNSAKLIYYSLLSKKESSSLSKAYFDKSVQDILYLVETGAIDIDDYRQLNIVTELTLKDNLKNYQTEFDYVDDLIEKRDKLEAENPYNEEIDNIEKIIDYSDEESFQDINGTTKKFVQGLASKYQDYDVLTLEAKKEADKITNGLSRSIPNPKFLFTQTSELEKHSQELENAIRQDIGLSAIPGGTGARVSGTLESTGGNNKISPPAVDLYSKGLTPEKLKGLELNKNSKTYEVLSRNRTLQKQIEFQIKKIHESVLGEEISKDIKKASDTFSRYSPTVQKILDPVGTAKTFVNKRIGQYAGNLILKNTSSAAAKKLGNFILENGLKEGAKKFADAAAKKLLIEGAKALGVQGAKVAGMAAAESAIGAAAAALGVSTGGLSLLIGAILIIGTEIIRLSYNKFKELYKDIWGVDFDAKEFGKGLAIGAGVVAGSLIVVNRGVRTFGFATKAAVVSAIGIVWLAIATISAFLTLTYLTAPLLSTLVQFDSEEKVTYTPNGVPATSNSDCGWPIEPGYKIQSGPSGGTHKMSSLEAIDIFGDAPIDKKPIYSSTDGIVTTNGNYSNYGHTIVIRTTNSAGTFDVIYGHVSSSNVSVDQKVTKGQKIGTVGSTELFDNPHLHFEYKGVNGAVFKYNQCPAGGVQVKEGCETFATCGSIITGDGPKVI